MKNYQYSVKYIKINQSFSLKLYGLSKSIDTGTPVDILYMHVETKRSRFWDTLRMNIVHFATIVN